MPISNTFDKATLSGLKGRFGNYAYAFGVRDLPIIPGCPGGKHVYQGSGEVQYHDGCVIPPSLGLSVSVKHTVYNDNTIFLMPTVIVNLMDVDSPTPANIRQAVVDSNFTFTSASSAYEENGNQKFTLAIGSFKEIYDACGVFVGYSGGASVQMTQYDPDTCESEVRFSTKYRWAYRSTLAGDVYSGVQLLKVIANVSAATTSSAVGQVTTAGLSLGDVVTIAP